MSQRPGPKPLPPARRFWPRVQVGWTDCRRSTPTGRASQTSHPEQEAVEERTELLWSDECWEWTGSRTANGYGHFDSTYAHRFAYESLVAPIPEGLHIDHLCRNRACCNPGHLEPVTQRENNFRARREACLRGHPFTPDSTRVERNGTRVCRICIRASGARRRARLRLAAAS